MSTQTKTWQRKHLAEAERRGNLPQLYWFIEMKVPGAYLKDWRDDGHTAASWPGYAVPVVPVAPDPDISRHWAELLAELFKVDNPRTHEFAPALTDHQRLLDIGKLWYVWGDPVPAGDIVCEWCGGVGACDCRAVRDAAGLALASGVGRTHITHGDTRALCGRTVRPRWAVPVTTWERRRWDGLDLCRTCERVYEGTKGA